MSQPLHLAGRGRICAAQGEVHACGQARAEDAGYIQGPGLPMRPEGRLHPEATSRAAQEALRMFYPAEYTPQN